MQNLNAISVSTLSNYLKQIIDAEELLYRVTIFGEIASFSVSGKACYFTIKDEQAILNCVLFDDYPNGYNLVGKKVYLKGTPKFYVKGGRFSFQVEAISPFGEGELQKRFLELKEKLANEGLFDLERKKQQPKKIATIGVVTSENGAVIQDIIDVATRRNPSINIVLYPVKVQGNFAEYEIKKGIDYFSDYDGVDAVIVARGGGSEEDLAAFNTEIVVRAVAACNKFIVSAVGHETNYSLCDYASDLRAPTPSAAAEILVDEIKNYYEIIDDKLLFARDLIVEKLINANTVLVDIIYEINNKVQEAVVDKQNYLEKLKLENEFLLFDKYKFFEFAYSKIVSEISNNNPINILNRGYVKIKDSNSRPIKTIDSIKSNDIINLEFSNGVATAEIKGVKKYEL